jgi:competence protein ComEC
LAFFFISLPAQALSEKSNLTDAHLIFWSVGQGDFISVDENSECLFFDVGGSHNLSKNMKAYLSIHCSEKTNYLFISHFDMDHFRNYRALLSIVKIKYAFFSHLDPKTKYGKLLLQTLLKNHIEIHRIAQGYHLALKDGSLSCLWPTRGFTDFKGENDHSLVLLFTHNGRRVFFTGDLPGKIESYLPSQPIEILKIGHHGSKTSSSQDFLSRIKPKECVVSVGAENHYGHPSRVTLLRLEKTGCTILRTDRLGNISFVL